MGEHDPLGSPLPRYRAGLTAGGRTLCTATTDTNGVAECDGMVGEPEPDGHDATFASTALLLPSTGHGNLVG